MRIALITRRYPPLVGGAEKMLSYLAEALADRGHEVRVLTSRLDVEGLSAEERVARGGGTLAVERLGTTPLRMIGTWIYMNNLRRALERFRPEIAYVSMLKHDAYVTIGVGARRGFPVVLRPEGAGATGDIAWHQVGRFGGRIARRCRDAAAFVTISSAVRLELEAAGFDLARVVDIPNGVKVPKALWNRREGWRNSPRAVYVGRLAPEKCVSTLVRAWPMVRKSFADARLSIVGDGPERDTLEGIAAENGVSESIAFVGAVADAEPYLREADVFVLPSQEEGMSIALLEAMALGMPIVASSIPGNRKLIGDFKQGRLFGAKDPSALARVIGEQWNELDRAIHMGRAARALVQNQYSIEAVARAHEALFARLVEANRARVAH